MKFTLLSVFVLLTSSSTSGLRYQKLHRSRRFEHKGFVKDQLEVGEVDPRVVGGLPIEIDEAPYTILFKITKRIPGYGPATATCGGVIYNEEYILSAAHCFLVQEGRTSKPVELRGVEAFAGKTRYHGIDDSEIQLTVIEIETHPKFDPYTNVNDIAVLRLNTSLNYNKYIKPLQIIEVHPSSVKDKLSFKVIGWGHTRKSYVNSLDPLVPTQQLQKGNVQFIDRDQCIKDIKSFNITKAFEPGTSSAERKQHGNIKKQLCRSLCNTTLCASSDGVDACQGDSGGPLVCTGIFSTHSPPRLCGLVSSGHGCASGLPSIYADVFNLKDWIIKVITDGYQRTINEP